MYPWLAYDRSQKPLQLQQELILPPQLRMLPLRASIPLRWDNLFLKESKSSSSIALLAVTEIRVEIIVRTFHRLIPHPLLFRFWMCLVLMKREYESFSLAGNWI